MQGNYSYVLSTGIHNHRAMIIRLEVNLRRGMPIFQISGMPSTYIRDSKDRIQAAMENSGYQFPLMRTTIHLNPGGFQKKGTHFDLAMALGLILASGQISEEIPTENILCYGELGLDGKIHSIPGITRLVPSIPGENYTLLLPEHNAWEIRGLTEHRVVTVDHLNQFWDSSWVKNDLLRNLPSPKKYLTLVTDASPEKNESKPQGMELYPGQALGWEALRIALAGRHHLLLTGTPGSGKTLLAEMAKYIQSTPSKTEWLEILQIHPSLAVESKQPVRPFRAPHHSLPPAGLIGGGTRLDYGEISLAHNGVLMIDELGEMNARVLQNLREPLEKGVIHLTRGSQWITLPANFQMLATSNLCPCGQYSSQDHSCLCRKDQIRNYLGKITGPILDRIDLIVEIFRPEKVTGKTKYIDFETEKIQIQKTRLIQENRKLTYDSYTGNHRSLLQWMDWDEKDYEKWDKIRESYQLGFRERETILKLARTIADLHEKTKVGESDIFSAIGLRDGCRSILAIAA